MKLLLLSTNCSPQGDCRNGALPSGLHTAQGTINTELLSPRLVLVQDDCCALSNGPHIRPPCPQNRCRRGWVHLGAIAVAGRCLAAECAPRASTSAQTTSANCAPGHSVSASDAESSEPRAVALQIVDNTTSHLNSPFAYDRIVAWVGVYMSVSEPFPVIAGVTPGLSPQPCSPCLVQITSRRADAPAAKDILKIAAHAAIEGPVRRAPLLVHLDGRAVGRHQPRVHHQEARQAQTKRRIDHECHKYDCRPASTVLHLHLSSQSPDLNCSGETSVHVRCTCAHA